MPPSSNASTPASTVDVNGGKLPMRVKESDVVSRYPASVVSVVPDPDNSDDDHRTIVHTCQSGHTLHLERSGSMGPEEISVAPKIILSRYPQRVPDGISLFCRNATGTSTFFPPPANGHLEHDPPYLCRETDDPDDHNKTIIVDVQAISADATVNCSPSATGDALTLETGLQTRLEGGKFKPNAAAVQWVKGDDRSRTIFNELSETEDGRSRSRQEGVSINKTLSWEMA